jgi:hypothetical protein
MESTSEKKSWWSRNWKWFVPVVGLGMIVVCVGCIALMATAIFGAIKSSDVYQQALIRVQENAEAREALGTPIKPGFWVSGSVEVSGPGGNADLAIPVSGPKNSGTLYVVATKSAGVWEYRTLQLAPNGSSDRIDLLAGR